MYGYALNNLNTRRQVLYDYLTVVCDNRVRIDYYRNNSGNLDPAGLKTFVLCYTSAHNKMLGDTLKPVKPYAGVL